MGLTSRCRGCYHQERTTSLTLLVLLLLVQFVSSSPPAWTSGGNSSPRHAPTTTAAAAGACVPVPRDSECSSQHYLPYTQTRFPNLANQTDMQEADETLKTFLPLLQSNCAPYLRHFLCGVFMPMCIDNVSFVSGGGTGGTGTTSAEQQHGEQQASSFYGQRLKRDSAAVADSSGQILVPPCRILCEHAQHTCAPLLEEFAHLPWPAVLECSRFPERNEGESMCLDYNLPALAPLGGGTMQGAAVLPASDSKIAAAPISEDDLKYNELLDRIMQPPPPPPPPPPAFEAEEHEKQHDGNIFGQIVNTVNRKTETKNLNENISPAANTRRNCTTFLPCSNRYSKDGTPRTIWIAIITAVFLCASTACIAILYEKHHCGSWAYSAQKFKSSSSPSQTVVVALQQQQQQQQQSSQTFMLMTLTEEEDEKARLQLCKLMILRISACMVLNSIGHYVQLAVMNGCTSMETIFACCGATTTTKHWLYNSTARSPCSMSFILTYYFQIAANIWMVILFLLYQPPIFVRVVRARRRTLRRWLLNFAMLVLPAAVAALDLLTRPKGSDDDDKVCIPYTAQQNDEQKLSSSLALSYAAPVVIASSAILAIAYSVWLRIKKSSRIRRWWNCCCPLRPLHRPNDDDHTLPSTFTTTTNSSAYSSAYSAASSSSSSTASSTQQPQQQQQDHYASPLDVNVPRPPPMHHDHNSSFNTSLRYCEQQLLRRHVNLIYYFVVCWLILLALWAAMFFILLFTTTSALWWWWSSSSWLNANAQFYVVLAIDVLKPAFALLLPFVAVKRLANPIAAVLAAIVPDFDQQHDKVNNTKNKNNNISNTGPVSSSSSFIAGAATGGKTNTQYQAQLQLQLQHQHQHQHQQHQLHPISAFNNTPLFNNNSVQQQPSYYFHPLLQQPPPPPPPPPSTQHFQMDRNSPPGNNAVVNNFMLASQFFNNHSPTQQLQQQFAMSHFSPTTAATAQQLLMNNNNNPTQQPLANLYANQQSLAARTPLSHRQHKINVIKSCSHPAPTITSEYRGGGGGGEACCSCDGCSNGALSSSNSNDDSSNCCSTPRRMHKTNRVVKQKTGY